MAPVVALLALAGCTPLDDFLASVPIFSFMRESPALDPYEAPRAAPPNAVPYASPLGAAMPPVEPTEASLNAFAEEIGPNPIPMTDERSIEIGQEQYQRLCFVCHGPVGQGGGPVVGQGKFPPVVPNIAVGPTVERSDGYLYGIIRAGRGLMPSYATQTDHLERWHIVNYVRYLQQQAEASGADAAAAGQSGASAAGRE